MNENVKTKIRCDACGKEFSREQIEYVNIQTCCSVKRVAVCKDCINKYNLRQK